MAEELTPEKQLIALNEQVTDLKTKSEQKDALIAEVKGQLKSQGKELATAIAARDQAKTDLADKVNHIRAIEAENEAKEQVITGYETRLRAADAQAEGGAPVVTHEEQIYRVVLPVFQFDGKSVKAEDLSNDASLVAKLVALGSGVLEKVEAKA